MLSRSAAFQPGGHATTHDVHVGEPAASQQSGCLGAPVIGTEDDGDGSLGILAQFVQAVGEVLQWQISGDFPQGHNGEDAEKETEPDRGLVGLYKGFQVPVPLYVERIPVIYGYTGRNQFANIQPIG